MVKYVIKPLHFILVGRDKKDSKDAREKLLADVAERQKLAEAGKAFPVSMYPEGATTNGESLLEFKRGAFESLGSVQPHFSKTWTLTGASIAPTNGQSILDWTLQLMATGASIFTLHQMPVFKPNEFFWKNHWDGKEEKWVAYARAVR